MTVSCWQSLYQELHESVAPFVNRGDKHFEMLWPIQRIHYINKMIIFKRFILDNPMISVYF